MKTNSALGEKSEEDVFDASSLCPLLELCMHHTLRRVFVKALGVSNVR